MEIKKYRLNSEVTGYGQVNNGFAKVKILVNTYEQVANGTKFSKELLDEKMSKLNYIPIIGEFKDENEDFGTHGGKLEISDDGFDFIDTTRPYGVVIENSGRWEKIKQKNGEEIDYVVCDGYVWIERYPELNALYEEKENNQSMEVNITSGHWGDDNIFYVEDFEYSALCILGKKIMPAFEEAKIEVNFESQNFKLKYEEMIQALDRYLGTSNTDEKEVFEMENENKEINENLKTEEKEFVEEKKSEETQVEKEDAFEEKTTEITEDKIDYKKAIEDLKTQISKYEISTQSLNSNLEKLQNDFNDLNEKYTNLLADNQELAKFKSDKLALDRKEQESELFAKFSKLDGDEEYEAIKSNAKNFSIEDLEKELALIFVRKNISTSYSSKQKEKSTLKVELDFNKDEKKDSPYGDVFEKYKK